jgi:AraC-like DNA-binding protein
MSHLWYLPVYFCDTNEEIMLMFMIGSLLDFLMVMPLAIIVMMVMLQDRRRPLWAVAFPIAPLVIGVIWCIYTKSDALLPVLYVYLILLGIGLLIYMVCEVRRYGRWLCDNYADLEHKEVWQSFVVLAAIIFVFTLYAFSINGLIFEWILQANDVILICYLLWRVETLSDLSMPQQQALAAEEAAAECAECSVSTSNAVIGGLLQQHCIDTQIYLQHDLSISQLAKVIGTNRLYLSQYFSGIGITYNTYINDLRINHFIDLYNEAAAAKRPFTAQQLAHDSGYRSYSTFGLAFKQRTGQTVTEWMQSRE